MEVSDSEKSAKKQKTNERQSGEENRDRISQLPESILHYILSFLPTKHAVGTSVLSTKWKHLWTETENLDFDDGLLHATKKEMKKKKKPFFGFVDRVLLANVVSNIHKFSLTCQESDAAHLDMWISSAIKRKVQELYLSITEKHPGKPLRSLFTCDSLRILKIEMDVSVDIPASVCLSNLKVLHLNRLSFSGDQSRREMSLSFPVLEEFVLHYCRWVEIKTVHISVPTLRRLNVKHWQREDLVDCEIKINAESLISLEFEGCPLYEYTLCHLSSLVEVYMDLPYYYTPDDKIIHRLGSLIRGLYNVEDLELRGDSIETLAHPAFAASIHSLSRLIRLKLKLRSCDLACSRRLIGLLGNMPNLEYLFFPFGLDAFMFKGNGRIMGTTPPCFLSNLKVVDIKRFRGIHNDIWFVKFMMKSARLMDKLTIKLTRCESDSLKRFEKSMNEVFGLLAKKSNCVLELS